MWSSQPWRYQRVGDDRAGGTDILVEHPVLSIVGGIQPHLHHLLGDEDSGFRPRWLAHVAPLEPVIWAERIHEPRDWDVVIRLLHANRDPREWTLTGPALKLWEQACQTWKQRASSGEENVSASKALIKADIQCARIAVVIAESLKPGAGGEIPARAMECAVAITDYVMACWRTLPDHEPFALSFRDEKLSRKVEQLQFWLETRDGKSATVRDILRAHVAGVRTARDCNTLLSEYEEVYPGAITTARTGARGPAAKIVYAPARDHPEPLEIAGGIPQALAVAPVKPVTATVTADTTPPAYAKEDAGHSPGQVEKTPHADGDSGGSGRSLATVKNSLVAADGPVPPEAPLTEAGARAAGKRLLDYLTTETRRANGPQLDSQWAGGAEIMTGFVMRYGIADAWRIAHITVKDLGCRWRAGGTDAQLTIQQFTAENAPALAAAVLEVLNHKSGQT
jgi:hypothetical protein